MIKNYLPSIEWMRNYNKTDLQEDLSAGIIVAIMLIPQGMAYAMLAGLPPVMGLYASSIPLIVYALFGSSRQLAVGPVAMISLLVFSGVSQIAKPGTEEYIAYTLLLAFMIGIMQLALGLARLGFLVNFLAHAVISGFTSAAAIIIALSQLKHILGYEIPNDAVFITIWHALTNIGQTNIVTLLIGIGSMFILFGMKKWLPKFPAALLVVVLGILAVRIFQLDEKGVAIVGEIPTGFPTFSLPMFQMEAIIDLLPIALTITFISFMESFAVAKKIAAKENYKINPNQELNGLGLANIFGSFFSAFPVTGGFSRSAVNYQAGAKTGLASIFTAMIIMMALQYFASLFYYLPQSVLAAIIIIAVIGLIDIKEPVQLFRMNKSDGWTLIITFLATLTFGAEQGIIIGIVVSLLIVIWQSAYPRIIELRFCQIAHEFKEVTKHPNVKTEKDIVFYRIKAPLYFANINRLESKLYEILEEKSNIKKIVLDFSCVNWLDAYAATEFKRIMDDFQDKEIKLHVVAITEEAETLFKKAGISAVYRNYIHDMPLDKFFRDRRRVQR